MAADTPTSSTESRKRAFAAPAFVVRKSATSDKASDPYLDGMDSGNGGVLLKGTAPAPLGQLLAKATIADAGTLTDAQHRGGIVTQDASGGNVTMTTRTAAQLVAAFAGAQVGTAVPLYVYGNHSSNTSTVAGGTGVTLRGSGAVTQTGGSFLLLFTNVTASSEAVDLIRVG